MFGRKIYRKPDGEEGSGASPAASNAAVGMVAGSAAPAPPAHTPSSPESAMRAQAFANRAVGTFLEGLEKVENLPGGVLELGIAAQAALAEASRQLEEVTGPAA